MRKDSAKFFDTNILVYEWDARESTKKEIARELVKEVGQDGVVSSQVLTEFGSVMRAKLHATTGQIRAILTSYRGFGFIPVDARLIESALETADNCQISYWDALVVEAAVRAGCQILYTEDLNSDQVLRGVQVINPFKT